MQEFQGETGEFAGQGGDARGPPAYKLKHAKSAPGIDSRDRCGMAIYTCNAFLNTKSNGQSRYLLPEIRLLLQADLRSPEHRILSFPFLLPVILQAIEGPA